MDTVLLALIASIPFILLFVLLIPAKKPAVKALPIVWLTALIIAFFVWRIEPIYIPSSFLKAIFMTIEIMLIVLGAVWLLELIKHTKHMKNIQEFFAGISPDARVQGIIIGWLFVSLMEGVAGFGTPAAIAAPLLVALGFTPILAVTVALIANFVATTFGAAGTPILLGFGNLGFERAILEQSGQFSAVFHAIASIVVPLAITYLIASKKKNAFKEFIPFALFAWLIFVIPYLLSALFIGPELPTIIASLLSLTIVSYAAKKNFLVPKNRITFKKQRKKQINPRKALFSAMPYMIIVLSLLITRAVLPIRIFLQSLKINLESILSSSLSFSYLPFFTPSFFFFLAIAVSTIVYKIPKKTITVTLKGSANRIKSAAIALIFALGLVQLLIASSNNTKGFAGMPILIAETLGNLFGSFYPFVSPFIGAFGSFISGSNTVSNILFGVFQTESAVALGLSIPIVLALQAAGGAVGNMIAIHNVLAASATVGLKDQESAIIRKTMFAMFIYLLILGILGMVATTVI